MLSTEGRAGGLRELRELRFHLAKLQSKVVVMFRGSTTGARESTSTKAKGERGRDGSTDHT